MKKLGKNWVLSNADIGMCQKWYIDHWHNSGEMGGVVIWWNVFKILLEKNGLEIREIKDDR